MKTSKLIIHLRARLWQIVFKIVLSFLTELAQKLGYFGPGHFSLLALLALDETFLFAFEIQDFSVSFSFLRIPIN